MEHILYTTIIELLRTRHGSNKMASVFGIHGPIVLTDAITHLDGCLPADHKTFVGEWLIYGR